MYLSLRILLSLIILLVCFNLFCEVDIESIVKRADSLLESGSAYSISEMTVYKSGKPRPTMKVEGYSMIEEGKT